MATRVTKAEHTRREFLRAAGVVAGAAGLAAAGGGAASASRALAEADVYEVNLLELGVPPESYTTQWPSGANTTVEVWDKAFREAHARLEKAGGGRLLVPGNDVAYYLRDHQVFDLRSVSIHLEAGCEVMMVGPKNPVLGAPIGFFGGLGDLRPPRVQRDFAALNGPGKIGYPPAQLEYYERGNAVGFSYIKTAHVEGVQIPAAPRFAMTAQYGCNKVTFRNNKIGYTGTPEEIRLPGHAVIQVSGGTYDDATRTVDPYGRRTEVHILNNTVDRGHRAVYIEHCGLVRVSDNNFGPLGGHGMTLGNCLGATVTDNTFQQLSRDAWASFDAMQFVDVADPIWVTDNRVLHRTHRHCVVSLDSANTTTKPGLIHSRNNYWTKGHRSVFNGSPAWDSVGDTTVE